MCLSCKYSKLKPVGWLGDIKKYYRRGGLI